MERIVIFGNSGSGKSTLAQQLAAAGDRAHLDLDTVAWEADCATPTRKAVADSHAAITPFLDTHHHWVIEGCYSDLLALVIPAATQMIFLNPGVETCIQNCRNRPWEPHKYPSPEAQDANLDMLINWIKQYESRRDEFSLQAHRKLFDAFQGPKQELVSNDRTGF